MSMKEKLLALLRIAAWSSMPGLIIASWTPGEYMIRTGLPGWYEHVGAYCVATLLWVLAYPQLPPAGVGAVLVPHVIESDAVF
jgi:hypothetical protein